MIPNVRVGDVVRVRHGGTPSKGNPAFWSGDIPWVSPKDFSGANLRAPLDFISGDAVSSSAACVVPAGTILAVVRSGVLAHSFPVALADRPISFNQDIKALIPDQRKIDPRFLHHFLRSAEQDIVHRGVKRGATVHSLQAGFLEGMFLRLPPLEEQRRIVDILDRAASIRRLRRQAQETARLIVPGLFNKMFGDPSSNPMGWPVLTLDHILAGGIQNGLYRPAAAYGKGTRILRIDSFYDGEVQNINALRRLSLDNDTIQKYLLRPKDIVLNRVNSLPYLGKSAIIPTMDEPVVFESNMMRFSTNPEQALPEYVIAYLQTSFARKLLVANAKAAINQASINQQDVGSLRIPVPALMVQTAFADRAKAMSRIVERQASARNAAEKSSQAIEAQMFST